MENLLERFVVGAGVALVFSLLSFLLTRKAKKKLIATLKQEEVDFESDEVKKEIDISVKLMYMKMVVFFLAGAILIGVLFCGINYGVTGRLLPGKNDVYYKATYSVSVQRLETKLGNKNFLKTRDTVITSYDGYNLTNRMLQVYYWDMVGNNQYADLDTDTPLDQQYQDVDSGKTWQQFYIEKAIDSWLRDTIVQKMAEEAGFVMPADYLTQFQTLEKDMLSAAVSRNYATVDAFLESMLGCGTDFTTYYNYLWAYFLGGTYWAEYIQTMEVDMEDIEAYYEKHSSSLVLDEYFQVTKDSGKLVDVRHILIQPEKDIKDKDGKTTGSSEEAWEAARVKAQEILDQWLAGEHTEDSFAKLATEKTEDSGSKSNGGLYTDTWKGKMVQAFEDWCFDESRTPGDYGLVKTDYGYHIMYFVGSEEGWIRLCTEGAQSAKASNMIDTLVAQITLDVDYKKIALADIE